MRKQIITSLALGVMLSGFGVGNSAYANQQAPINITVQKLYYENKDDVNYKQEAAVVTDTQVWNKGQFGDVAFTLYKVDESLVGETSPVKVAQGVQDAIASGTELPYGAKEYKSQLSINEQGLVDFTDVDAGAAYVLVETLHSSKVDLKAKPVYLRVDGENPSNIKVYLKNEPPKKEENPLIKEDKLPKKEEPKKEQPKRSVGSLFKTGLTSGYNLVVGISLLGLISIVVLRRWRNKEG